MNRETIKSFILFVLVGLSFLLSYILWSYQPKYEMFYDASYVNEVDVGGKENSKQELIQPSYIIFHREDEILGFASPFDQQKLFKEITSWSLSNLSVASASGEPIRQWEHYVEVIFPTPLPVNLLANLFTIEDEEELPLWHFDRIFIFAEENTELLNVKIVSQDESEQLVATIEKARAYQIINRYDENHAQLQTYLEVPFGTRQIYIPDDVDKMTKKTLVANLIEPELFTNVLFSNPSLVKPNQREVFYTDGQRGMRVQQEGRYLEFINPIETSGKTLSADDLLERSVNHINEHKGWFNEYHLESLYVTRGEVNYRLHYEGRPVFNFSNLTLITQVWRDQELYQYHRSLLYIGHLLNVTDTELPSGVEIIQTIQQAEDFAPDQITDIQIGYLLNYIDEAHSITLEPAWFMRYENSWLKVPLMNNGANSEGIRGD